MRIEKLLTSDVRVVSVVCNQWGDTGKGKISDLIASDWADVIARGTGGNNAGHTVIVNGREHILHLIPAGIINDSRGKVNILGNGMVIDLRALCCEMDELEAQEVSYNNLMISKDANVVMPYHVIADQGSQSQKDGGIGTTGRGIGPAYADKIARRGISLEDFFDKDKLQRKIEKASQDWKYHNQEIGSDEIIESLMPFAERIRPLVRDTVSEMHQFMRNGKRILLEGAQGLLLSIEHGTYPYVTSSDCSLNGLASGVGLSAGMVDLPLGVVKFPFMTRVGGGAFPTELGGNQSEEYCAKGLEHDIFYEVKEYLGMDIDLENVRILQSEKRTGELLDYRRRVNGYIKSHKDDVVRLMNSTDQFAQGVGIRLSAGEYGATTARPRRIGWTDAVAAKYAVGINGSLIILTKVDSISGSNEFGICYGYENATGVYRDFNREDGFLKSVKPVNASYSGHGDIRDIQSYDALPKGVVNSVSDFEKFTGGRVVAISNGAERDQLILR